MKKYELNIELNNEIVDGSTVDLTLDEIDFNLYDSDNILDCCYEEPVFYEFGDNFYFV